MAEGWVKLHRKMVEWEWFTDPFTSHLFLYILLKANHEPKKYRGIDVPAGGLTTSVAALSRATGLSTQQVRTALKHLISTNEITSETTTKFTLLKVNNWDLYQDANKQANKQLTNEQQTTNKQLTTNKNERMKECKNGRNNKKPIGSFDPLSVVCERYENPEIREAFKNFFEVRKKQKKPVATERTLNTLINKLEELAFSDDERIEIIDQSAERGWLSFFELKQKPSGYSKVPDEILAWGDKGNV